MYLFQLIISLIFSFHVALAATPPSIVLSPAKIEVEMAPGATITRNLTLTNQLSTDAQITLSIEDIEGSNDPSEAIKLLGNRTGVYSLKNYVSFINKDFNLKDSSSVVIPVTITIPQSTPPGGLYGSVLVSAKGQSTSGSNIKLISRLGSLFFVRVSGDVKEEGKLIKFGKDKNVFKILYENSGDIYLNPYGIIIIKNFIGQEVASQEIDPWFVLPHSSRTRTLEWEHGPLLGHYTAELYLNRGYEDIVDKASFSFWMFSWGRFFTALSVVILVGLVYFLWRSIKTKSYF